jgi:CheY-like chemotaxis protein
MGHDDADAVKKPRILIADDEPNLRLLWQRVLPRNWKTVFT